MWGCCEGRRGWRGWRVHWCLLGGGGTNRGWACVSCWGRAAGGGNGETGRGTRGGGGVARGEERAGLGGRLANPPQLKFAPPPARLSLTPHTINPHPKHTRTNYLPPPPHPHPSHTPPHPPTPNSLGNQSWGGRPSGRGAVVGAMVGQLVWGSGTHRAWGYGGAVRHGGLTAGSQEVYEAGSGSPDSWASISGPPSVAATCIAGQLPPFISHASRCYLQCCLGSGWGGAPHYSPGSGGSSQKQTTSAKVLLPVLSPHPAPCDMRRACAGHEDRGWIIGCDGLTVGIFLSFNSTILSQRMLIGYKSRELLSSDRTK